MKTHSAYYDLINQTTDFYEVRRNLIRLYSFLFACNLGFLMTLSYFYFQDLKFMLLWFFSASGFIYLLAIIKALNPLYEEDTKKQLQLLRELTSIVAFDENRFVTVTSDLYSKTYQMNWFADDSGGYLKANGEQILISKKQYHELTC